MRAWMRAAAVAWLCCAAAACRPGFGVPDAASPRFHFYLVEQGRKIEGAFDTSDPLVDRIELTGRGPHGSEFVLASRGPECSVPELCGGKWRFSACAFNCQGRVAARGSEDFEVSAKNDEGHGGPDDTFDIFLYGADARPVVDVTVERPGQGQLGAGLAGQVEVQIAPFKADEGNGAVEDGALEMALEGAFEGATDLPVTASSELGGGFGRAYVLSAQVYSEAGDAERKCTGGDAWLFRVVPGLHLQAELELVPEAESGEVLSIQGRIRPVSVFSEPAEISGISPPLFAGRTFACRAVSGSGTGAWAGVGTEIGGRAGAATTAGLWFLDGHQAGHSRLLDLNGDDAPSEGPHCLTFIRDYWETVGGNGADGSYSAPTCRIARRSLQFVKPIRVGPMVLTRLYRRGERFPPDEFMSSCFPETTAVDFSFQPTGISGLRGLSISPDGRWLAAAGYSSDALVIFNACSPPAPDTDGSGADDSERGSSADGSGVLQQAAVARDSSATPLDGVSDTAFLDGGPSTDTTLLVAAAKNSSALTLWLVEPEAGDQTGLELLDALSPGALEASGASALSDCLIGVCAIATAPGGSEFYCCSEDSGRISMWRADSETGIIRQFAWGPPAGCEGATDIAVSTDGLWAAAAYKDSDSVCIFSRDPMSGTLTDHTIFTDETDGVEELNGVHQLTFQGHHLYTTSYYDDAVCLFTLTQENEPGLWEYGGCWEEFGIIQEPQSAFSSDDIGAAAAGYSLDIGTLNYTQGLAVSPDGAWVAVAAGGNDALCLWSRNLDDGSLQPAAAIQQGAFQGCAAQEGTAQGGAQDVQSPLPGFSGPLEGLDGARSVLWTPLSSDTGPLTLYCAASNSNALLVLEEW